MRSPLSLMAASSGEKEQIVPCDGGEEAKSDKSVKEGKDLVNGSPDEDFALINFVGMKMGDGLDKTSEVGESSESKVGTEHSSDEKETEQSTKEDVKAVKDDGVVRREPRAKMSISPARLLGRSLLGFDKTANGDTGKASSKTQCNSIVDGEATDGTDSGISSLSNCEVETRTCDGGSEASSTTSSIALSVTGEKLVNGRVSEERGEEGDSTHKLSSASSSNSKALPKARKSVQSASKTSVKTVNLAPISNKTVKLADLESALKCDKVIDSDSSKKEESEEDLTNNNVDSTGETKDSKNSVKVKKKRKFRTGNYSFPGQKKKKRYLKKCDESNSVDNSCDRSVSSTASVDDMEGLDGEGDDSLNSSTEPRLESNEGTNAMTVLSQNAHLAFRAAGKAKITARKKIRPSPKGKSLKDMLDSMKRTQALRQQADLESKENSNSRTEFSDEEKNDFVDGDDMREESETMTALRKRKTHGGDNSSSDEDETHMETSAPVLNSSLSGKKQRTEERNETTPTKPVVTIVSEHTPTPGLKSLLPKPVTSQSSLSSSKDLSSPLAVLSNQLAASRNSSVPKPMGPKNSEALRALLVSGSSFGGRSGTVTTMPVTGQVKQECGELINGERVVAPRDSKGASTPNGLCYPVTPPKTPEDGTACDNSSRPPSCPTSAASTSPDRDIIPLCCCKINGASFNKLTSGVTYCQALDSVDGKVMGCCNKVSNSQLVRPAVKIPFMAVCEAHRKRLKLHQCCPGCGHFCTQGKFYQCGKEGGAWMHSFHKQCQVFKDGRFYCPHCGEESVQMEVSLGYTDQPHSAESADTAKNSRRSLSKLKPSFVFAAVKGKESELGETAPGVTFTLPSSRTISSEGLPLGPSRHALEKMLNSLEQERPKKYRNLSKSMYLPAYEGDLEKVIYMLIDGVDPNLTYEDYEGETALHGAAASDHLAIVHVLVQAGAALHLKDRTLKTPLMMAAEHNKPRVVQYLLKVGARIDDKGEDGMTSIHYAAKAGHTEVIKLLLDSDKIGPNIQDDGGWTPIIWAAESQLVTTVKYLMSQGADPTLKDNEENTGLHWAAYAGSVPIMDLFLEYGCELDTPNEHGDRPLHIAARQNHYECVVLLLARGADVETRNNNQETPLTCCLDQTSSTWMALKVNKQLKGFAAKLARPEKLLHRDVSCGREKNPIACVNAIDEESFPNDYLYVAENVETSPLNINRVITSLQSCRCKDDCSSQFCVCARSSVKCWFDKYGRLSTDFNLVEPPLLFECNKACRCWTNCNNRVVQNGITCRLQLFRTNGRGWGVKTLTDISPGTFICEYIGELISDSEADRREDDSYLFDLDNKDGETYCIDARKYGNVSRFINHLCEPNVVPVKVFVDHQDLRFPRICFFSSREIRAHEELGFDYGEKFWIIKWKQFTCACQSPKCKYSSETIHKTLQEYRIRHEEEELPTPADV